MGYMEHRDKDERWREFKIYTCLWDFPGGPVVKNLPSNAGDAGSIPGRGTRIPHAAEQLSLCAARKDPACPACTTQPKVSK